MYKVILVDDEPWSLISLKNAFQWSQYGFEVVSETTNPLEAFDIMCRDGIDVGFIDIRMPEVSGLDLIRMAREKELDIEYVIVSGFAEFAYARQALKEGVYDYLLKPAQLDETDALLKRLSDDLRLKTITNDLSTFERLVEGCNTEDILASRGFRGGCGYYHVYLVQGEGNSRHPGGTVLSGIPWLSSQPGCLELNLGLNKHVYILGSCSQAPEDIKRYMDEAGGRSAVYSGGAAVCIGISSTGTGMQDIPRLLKEAEISLNRRFTGGFDKPSPEKTIHPCLSRTSGVPSDPRSSGNSGSGGSEGYCCIYPYRRAEYCRINEVLKDILACIDLCSLKELQYIFKDLPDQFSRYGYGLEEAVYLWNQVVAGVMRKYSAGEADDELDFLSYREIINKFSDFGAMCGYLFEAVSSLYNKERQVPDNLCPSEAFNELLEYVNQNFDRNIYLKELAQAFHINFTYCSDLFRKVTGSTFTQYVTTLRMNKASRLLSGTRMSVEEICRLTGFNDYYYFNNVFKKYFGCTPVKYRKSGIGAQEAEKS